MSKNPVTTKQRILELRRLSAASDKNIYRRIQLADQILADRDWLCDEWKGNQLAAMEYLESHYFASLAGYVSLGTLLEIFRMFSDREIWEEYRYNLRAMQILWQQERKKQAANDNQKVKTRKTTWRRPSVAAVRELETKVSELEKQEKQQRKVAEAATQEKEAAKETAAVAAAAKKEAIAATSEARVFAKTADEKVKAYQETIKLLERENAQLRSRVNELESLLEGSELYTT